MDAILDAQSREPFLRDSDRRRAGLALAVTIALGAVSQALFWRTGLGLNFWIWDLLAIGALVAIYRRGRIRPTAWGAMVASSFLGFSVLHYASDWAVTIAIPFNLALLAVLPILLRDGVTLTDLAGVPWKVLGSIVHVPTALGRAAQIPARAIGGRGQSWLSGIARGLLIGAPIAGLFVLLFSSDEGFMRALVRAKDELGEGALFVLASAVTSAGYLVTHVLHATAKAARNALGQEAVSPYRALALRSTNAPPKSRASVATWAMVIGQVSLVFALFVGANFRNLFGGHRLVRSSENLTYAGYLHAGFAQLLIATILAVCLVLIGHALLRAPKASCAERDKAIPGGALLTALEAFLLVLTGITVASCWQRLRIYEEVYGASHLRLGVAFVEIAVLGVLTITLAKVVFRTWRGHGGAVLAFATGLAVLATGFNTDRYIAETNLDRAARGNLLDVDYLASLSPDARDVLSHPVVQAVPMLASRLAERFCHPAKSDWRAERGLGRCKP